MTLLTPGGYCKGDVGRKDTGLGKEYHFYNSVIVYDCFGLFFFFFALQLCTVWVVVASS